MQQGLFTLQDILPPSKKFMAVGGGGGGGGGWGELAKMILIFHGTDALCVTESKMENKNNIFGSLFPFALWEVSPPTCQKNLKKRLCDFASPAAGFRGFPNV